MHVAKWGNSLAVRLPKALVDELRLAVKKLDKAAQRGIIHRNQAANRKSALMRHAARAGASASAE